MAIISIEHQRLSIILLLQYTWRQVWGKQGLRELLSRKMFLETVGSLYWSSKKVPCLHHGTRWLCSMFNEKWEEHVDFVKLNSNLIDFAFQMDCDRTEWCQWISNDAIMDLKSLGKRPSDLHISKLRVISHLMISNSCEFYIPQGGLGQRKISVLFGWFTTTTPDNQGSGEDQTVVRWM